MHVVIVKGHRIIRKKPHIIFLLLFVFNGYHYNNDSHLFYALANDIKESHNKNFPKCLHYR